MENCFILCGKGNEERFRHHLSMYFIKYLFYVFFLFTFRREYNISLYKLDDIEMKYYEVDRFLCENFPDVHYDRNKFLLPFRWFGLIPKKNIVLFLLIELMQSLQPNKMKKGVWWRRSNSSIDTKYYQFCPGGASSKNSSNLDILKEISCILSNFQIRHCFAIVFV